MSHISLLNAAKIICLDGFAELHLEETLDGMLLVEVVDYRDRVQIGMRDSDGISYRFASDLLSKHSANPETSVDKGTKEKS